ncbi:MAG: hypothetical protein IT436_11905 [Phycisphaerales bacterium]|nr:hypothetical protein [Phycisphaerales bacterium]
MSTIHAPALPSAPRRLLLSPLRPLRPLRSIPPFLLLPLTACSTAPYPLHANQTLAQTREVVNANFPPGMPLDTVRSTLENLRVKRGDQLLYEPTATRPKVLLARLWEPGGFWITESDQTIKWTDLSFLFDPADKLERTLIYQDGNRYFEGRPAYPPSRPLEGGIRDWPGRPGPPIDPIEKAE